MRPLAPVTSSLDPPIPPSGRACLVQPLPLAAGLGIGVDPFAPAWWRVLTVAASPADGGSSREPLVAALCDAGLLELCDGAPGGVRLCSVPAAAAHRVRIWRRLAAVDSLHRWLHAPVDEVLISAERAVVRWHAARCLARGPAREELLAQAMDLAGHVADRSLPSITPPLPPALHATLTWVAEGLGDLAAVSPDPRELLTATTPVWRALRAPARRPARSGVPSLGASQPRLADVRAGRVDPRRVPARVVDLAESPTTGEITTRAIVINGLDVMEVEVPAFPALTEQDLDRVRRHLLARFLDRVTDQVVAQLTLDVETRADAQGKRHVLHTRLPLDGLDPARLRVEIVDVTLDATAPATGTPCDLDEARGALRQLREQRIEGAAQDLGLLTEQPPDLDEQAPSTAADCATPRDPGAPLLAELTLVHELSRAGARRPDASGTEPQPGL